MVGFVSAAVMLMAVLGGAWGWHVGTRRLYRRSYFVDLADERGVARRNRQRKAERFLLAALYAASVAAGAAVVVGLVLKR
jgi:hypothetical protein